MSSTGKVSLGTPTRLRSFDPVRLADLECRAWVGYYLRRWPRLLAASVGLVAREAQSGEVAGIVNVNEIVMGLLCSAYLGYHGMVRFAGQGLMTEALGKSVRFAFDELGLHRVEANIQPANHRSIALVKRIGFRREGFSPRYLKIAGAWLKDLLDIPAGASFALVTGCQMAHATALVVARHHVLAAAGHDVAREVEPGHAERTCRSACRPIVSDGGAEKARTA